MSNHLKRILTGIILILIVGSILLWGATIHLQFLIFVVSGVALWEFLSLFFEKSFFLKTFAIFLSIPIIFNNFLPLSLIHILIIYFWLINLIFLFIFGLSEKNRSWQDFQLIFLGLIYIPLVLQFFKDIPFKEICYIMGIAVFSDTCAYYSGTMWGKKKLWPKVSPKKSWVGAFGSLAGALIFSILYGSFAFSMKWYLPIFLAIVLNLGAQLGDLFESALKRYLNVKDSGGILPGHGGILDRIDSLLFVCAIYLIIKNFITI